MKKNDIYEIRHMLDTLGIKEVNHGIHDGLQWVPTGGELLRSHSPADGELIGAVRQATWDDYEKMIAQAQPAFREWRMWPAPRRGEVVRQIGLELRKYKEPLGKLVSYEMGKIRQEGLGEVQEMIDIADYAVGLSRQLYGFTMHSERPKHRMYEQYHPLGVVGIITAFNFPVAVWAWNAMIALVCGDVVIWKPSSKVPLCAIAVHHVLAVAALQQIGAAAAMHGVIEKVLRENEVPAGVVNLVASGSRYIGDDFLADKRVPLISVTGSVKVGRRVASIVGERLGKTILELGGNNAMIISQYGNKEMALRASLFGAIATTGQRCTSTRRLIIHECMFDIFKDKLISAYRQIKIGHPLDESTVAGPLIDENAVKDFTEAQKKIVEQGGKILYGGEVPGKEEYGSGSYVVPCIAEVENHFPIVQEETFAPILYLIKYNNIEEAIGIHNDVPQGLSSAIFSKNILETERFLSHEGSDCGIANVNIATNGAEIGGAFGGEKDTGGGRESGSDSWKAYMRRQTNTLNFSTELPLAQGISFDVFESE